MIWHPTDCQYDLGIGPTLSRLEISSTTSATDNGGAVIFYQKKNRRRRRYLQRSKVYAIIYYLAKPWFALEVVGVQTGAH